MLGGRGRSEKPSKFRWWMDIQRRWRKKSTRWKWKTVLIKIEHQQKAANRLCPFTFSIHLFQSLENQSNEINDFLNQWFKESRKKTSRCHIKTNWICAPKYDSISQQQQQQKRHIFTAISKTSSCLLVFFCVCDLAVHTLNVCSYAVLPSKKSHTKKKFRLE